MLITSALARMIRPPWLARPDGTVHVRAYCLHVYWYAVVDETLSIIGRDATALVALNLNACQASRDDVAAAMRYSQMWPT